MMKLKLLLLLALGGAVGCKAYPTYKNLPVDCTVEASYDMMSIDSFDMVGAAPGWTAVDGTVGAGMVGAVEALTDGARCGSTAALVIRASNNNDWGSLFGYNNFARDGSPYEGLSFWARSPGNSNKAFTIILNDPNTACLGTDAGVCVVPPGDCFTYDTDGGTAAPKTDGTGAIIPGTGGSAPAADACGNGYAAVQTVTADWRFYTIPYAEFRQDSNPNRVPNAVLTQTGTTPGTTLRTRELLTLILRMPKGMASEIFIDNLGFYRGRSATGGDGGVDAPQM
jgi:hypothetical protein